MLADREEIVELLKKHQNDGKLIVVDFFAKWCGPCKMISPQVEKLEQEYNYNVIVRKVDVDENEEFSHECNVGGMPTFLFFKNMKQVGKVVGANLEAIHNTIQAHL